MTDQAQLHPPISISLNPRPLDPPAHITQRQDSVSDDDLSQFGAELEKSLSAASSDVPNANPLVQEDSEDAESEGETNAVTHHKGRRTSVKEYFDPELYGLRRSV